LKPAATAQRGGSWRRGRGGPRSARGRLPQAEGDAAGDGGAEQDVLSVGVVFVVLEELVGLVQQPTAAEHAHDAQADLVHHALDLGRRERGRGMEDHRPRGVLREDPVGG